MSNKAAVAGKALNMSTHLAPQWTGNKLVSLFCTPFGKSLYTPKEEKFLQKAVQVNIEIEDSFVVCHNFKGDGPTVLLAHGWESHTARWRVLINQLIRAKYNIISIDAPAHGKSPGTQINGVLYAHVVSKAMTAFNPEFCIGHSFGGMAMAYYYSTYADAIPCKKLILMGVPENLEIIMNQFIHALSLSESAKAALYKAFEKRFDFPVKAFDIIEILKIVKQEGLIIHDRQDSVAPFAGAEAMAEAWKGCELFATDGLGHSLQSAEVFRRVIAELEEQTDLQE